MTERADGRVDTGQRGCERDRVDVIFSRTPNQDRGLEPAITFRIRHDLLRPTKPRCSHDGLGVRSLDRLAALVEDAWECDSAIVVGLDVGMKALPQHWRKPRYELAELVRRSRERRIVPHGPQPLRELGRWWFLLAPHQLDVATRSAHEEV